MTPADFTLRRTAHSENATLGELLDGDNKHLCFILENRPERRGEGKQPGKTRIPAGRYRLRLRGDGQFWQRYTARWKWHAEMIEIVLEGWQWVMFHIGNRHTDTAGCPLTGIGWSGGGKAGDYIVAESARAYERVYPLLLAHVRAGGWLLVRDEPELTHAGTMI